MNLGEFKDHISSFPKGHIFQYRISAPFSWRGSYDEVCFSVMASPATREEILKHIDMAIGGTFEGWKGGDYVYEENTKVNFEEEPRAYTDGQYCAKWIAIIEDSPEYRTMEERLVKRAFK